MAACFALLASGCGAADKSSAPPLPLPVVLTVKTPDTGWRLQIDHIFERDNEIWILARLDRPPGPAAQMIHPANVEVPIALPAKPLRVFVAGKTWAWRNDETYEFVSSLAPVIRQAERARVLYSVENKR